MHALSSRLPSFPQGLGKTITALSLVLKTRPALPLAPEGAVIEWTVDARGGRNGFYSASALEAARLEASRNGDGGGGSGGSDGDSGEEDVGGAGGVGSGRQQPNGSPSGGRSRGRGPASCRRRIRMSCTRFPR